MLLEERDEFIAILSYKCSDVLHPNTMAWLKLFLFFNCCSNFFATVAYTINPRSLHSIYLILKGIQHSKHAGNPYLVIRLTSAARFRSTAASEDKIL